MHKLIQFGGNATRSLRRFDLRQGVIVPELDMSELETYRGFQDTLAPKSLSLSPDGTKLVSHSTNATTDNFWLWEDTTDPQYTIPVATYAGTIAASAASNTYFAIGGGSPLLYVFDWATLSLQTVSVTGLGTVTGLSFSLDGTMLAVTHTTSPYLRVYDTTAWTYTNAVTSAGAGRSTVCFTPDSTHVVTAGTSSPYLTVTTANMATRTRALTGTAYAVSTDNSVMLPHPELTDVVLITRGGQSGTRYGVYEYDHVTDTRVEYVGSSTAQFYGAAYDLVNRYLYVAYEGTHEIRVFNMDTQVEVTDTTFENMLNMLGIGSRAHMVVINLDGHKLTGTVRDDTNTPVDREVRAYRRSNGKLTATTVSDSGTGDYELLLPDDGPYDVQFMIDPGELLNDLFYARVDPEAL